jgi:uridine monophosphate synthetase
MTSTDTSFFSCLEKRVSTANSLLCIGLDPHVSQLKSSGKEPTAEDAKKFCLNIIQQSAPFAAAFKPNSAFFEYFGSDGMKALAEVIEAIPPEIPVILDVKRGDIETTAQAYAFASYEMCKGMNDNINLFVNIVHYLFSFKLFALLVGSVTLAPYMGWDSVRPFVSGDFQGKGVFVLCKTSNPSSADFQNQEFADGTTLFEKVAKKCSEWNSSLVTPAIGLVVGKPLDFAHLFPCLYSYNKTVCFSCSARRH